MTINDTTNRAFNHSLNFRCQVTICSDDIVTLSVDNFTLFTHDIIVLKDLFTGIVVISFDTFLSRFNLTCQHTRLNGLFRHVETFKDSLQAFRTKTFHQIIFKR